LEKRSVFVDDLAQKLAAYERISSGGGEPRDFLALRLPVDCCCGGYRWFVIGGDETITFELRLDSWMIGAARSVGRTYP
jgi:hypothetical protein